MNSLGKITCLFSDRVNTFERFARYFTNPERFDYEVAIFVETATTIEAKVAGSIQQILRSQPNPKAVESCRSWPTCSVDRRNADSQDAQMNQVARSSDHCSSSKDRECTDLSGQSLLQILLV